MRTHKLDIRIVRHGLALLCASVLLAGCGLAGGGGSLAKGSQYQAEGKYRAAYIEAKKVLQNDNTNGNAWLLLGQASLMLGDTNDALGDLEKAKANGVPPEHWSVPMGRALLALGQDQKLLDTVSVDNALGPKVKGQVRVLRGDAYRALERLASARVAYQAAVALDPKHALALVGLAKLAAIDKDQDSANQFVQQALAAAPESPQAWVAKADLEFDNADYAGAETDYQKALDIKHPDWLPQERFMALSRLADAQVQQHHFDKALASIQELEKMAPTQPYPHYLHAVVAYGQDKWDEAISELQQVLKVAPDNAKAQFLLGMVNYAKGSYAQAEMYLSNVLGVDKNNVDARKLLALTYYHEGRSGQALDMMRPIAPGSPTDAQLLAALKQAAAAGAGPLKLTPPASSAGAAGNPTESRFVRADRALVSGNESEAIRLLQEIPAGNASTDARRTTLLVISYVREKRLDEAVKVAADYAAKHPRDSAAHLLYGTALITTGKRDAARAQYSEALKLNPKNLAAQLSLGSLESLEGHFKEAIGHYNEVLKLDPKNAVAMTSLGHLAARQGDRATAIKWFNQAIAASPKSAAAYLGLITLYSQGGQLDDALSTAKQMANVLPDNPAALNALGAAQLNAGHHADALKPLQQAVSLAPQAIQYRINLARAQALGKDTADAAANLDEVIKADPANVNAVGMRAFLKLQAHDLPGAIAMAKALQQQANTKAAGFALEGDLYMANKSWGDAAKAYKNGLKINDNQPFVIKTFEALSASGAKQPEGTLTDWLAKHPDDGVVRMLLGQYYLGQNQNKQAADEYERVLKQHPDTVGALNNLAWIYVEQHNPKALALAEKAHKLAPNASSVADTYGWALLAANKPADALPILTQAAKASPTAPTIHYHLAVAQARTGNKAAAKATLEALQKSGGDYPEKQAAAKLYVELGGAGGDSGK